MTTIAYFAFAIPLCLSASCSSVSFGDKVVKGSELLALTLPSVKDDGEAVEDVGSETTAVGRSDVMGRKRAALGGIPNQLGNHIVDVGGP